MSDIPVNPNNLNENINDDVFENACTQHCDKCDTGTACDIAADDIEGISTLMEELAQAKQKCEEYLDLAQRTAAEFANYRKRTKNTYADAMCEGEKDVIISLLPIIDNFERALAVETTDTALYEGLEMIYKALKETLEKQGLSTIEAVGEKFDPELHDAVMRAPAQDGQPGCIQAEFQKGYMLNGKVIRHSMVSVTAEE